MTEQHPITPPPELVQQWAGMRPKNDAVQQNWIEIATQAARWGADQELESCCEWVSQFNYDDYRYGDRLRAARRRPKPPSLAEQALDAIDEEQADITLVNYKVIRAALERLQELENNG